VRALQKYDLSGKKDKNGDRIKNDTEPIDRELKKILLLENIFKRKEKDEMRKKKLREKRESRLKLKL
jgi:hypothetical protein